MGYVMTIENFFDTPKTMDIIQLNSIVYDLVEKLLPIYTSNKYTIYIPSRHRPECKVTNVLRGLQYKVVVEPQDYDSYCKIHGKETVISLPKDNQGLPYARTFIKNYSAGLGEARHWQIDDDIEAFKVRPLGQSKNLVVNPILCLSIAEYVTDMVSNVAITGINGDTFAFSRRNMVQLNKLTCQCVLIDNAVDAEWEYGGMEDWDYTLKVLEAGNCTLAFDHIMTHSPAPGVRPGGNTEIHYQSDELKLTMEKFVIRWPNRFLIQKEEFSGKLWRLKSARRFFNDYKQTLRITS
jgi:hypothetical protein